MKKSVLLLSLVLVVFASCDKVKQPIEKKDTVVGTSFITKSNAAESNFKKVLLEDYTGPYCGNCPPAAAVAASLHAQYTPSVVVIAVHAGYFAYAHGPSFPGTFSTTVGEAWDGATGFGVSLIGNPNGMVDRKIFPGFTLVHNQTKWPSTVALALQTPFIVRMDVTTNYDTVVRALNFKTTYTNNINISAVITEDGLTGNQKDYTVPSPGIVADYDFEHVLRSDINSSWGSLLKSTPTAANDTARVSFNNFPVSTAFNDKKLSVVVFAYDVVTKEVLQVEKVKIR
jgi:hypothetical protein